MTVSRRDFVKSAGGLLIGFSFAGPLGQTLQGQAPTVRPPAGPPPVGPPLARIDSWLRIAPDGAVTVCTGKVEVGMGVNVALTQIVAEELDVPMNRVTMIMGDTSGTPDQGGVGASNSVASGGQRFAMSRPRFAASCCKPRPGVWARLWISSRCRTARISSTARPVAIRLIRRAGPRARTRRRAESQRQRLYLERPGIRQAEKSRELLGGRDVGPDGTTSRTRCSARFGTSSTFACPTCCTVASFGLRRSACRSSASTRAWPSA